MRVRDLQGFWHCHVPAAGIHLGLANSVPLRAALVPQRILRRVGVHKGAGEYPLVNRIPLSPIRFMFGVCKYSEYESSTSGCIFAESWLQPWSSVRMRRKFGGDLADKLMANPVSANRWRDFFT